MTGPAQNHTSLWSLEHNMREGERHGNIWHFICDKRQDPSYAAAIRDPENESSLSLGIITQTKPGGLLCEKIISNSVALITLLIFPIPHQPAHRWASTVSHTPAIRENAMQFAFMHSDRQVDSAWNLLQTALLTGKAKPPGIMPVCQIHWALLTKTGTNKLHLWINATLTIYRIYHF